MVKKLDVILSLTSGIIIGGISFLHNDSLNTMLFKLITVIIVFYLLGSITQWMIIKTYAHSKNENNSEDPNEDQI